MLIPEAQVQNLIALHFQLSLFLKNKIKSLPGNHAKLQNEHLHLTPTKIHITPLHTNTNSKIRMHWKGSYSAKPAKIFCYCIQIGRRHKIHKTFFFKSNNELFAGMMIPFRRRRCASDWGTPHIIDRNPRLLSVK